MSVSPPFLSQSIAKWYNMNCALGHSFAFDIRSPNLTAHVYFEDFWSKWLLWCVLKQWSLPSVGRLFKDVLSRLEHFMDGCRKLLSMPRLLQWMRKPRLDHLCGFPLPRSQVWNSSRKQPLLTCLVKAERTLPLCWENSWNSNGLAHICIFCILQIGWQG